MNFSDRKERLIALSQVVTDLRARIADDRRALRAAEAEMDGLLAPKAPPSSDAASKTSRVRAAVDAALPRSVSARDVARSTGIARPTVQAMLPQLAGRKLIARVAPGRYLGFTPVTQPPAPPADP